jgi:hypothetical protein
MISNKKEILNEIEKRYGDIMSQLAESIVEIDQNKRISTSKILELISKNQAKSNEQFLLINKNETNKSDEFFDEIENSDLNLIKKNEESFKIQNDENKIQIISEFIFNGNGGEDFIKNLKKEEIEKIYNNFVNFNLKLKKSEIRIKELEENLQEKNEEIFLITNSNEVKFIFF